MRSALFKQGFSVLLMLIMSSPLYALQCDISIRNEWNNGFTADVTLVNDTEQAIDGWQVTLTYDDGSQITNMWNADVSGSNPFTASSKSYNAKISVQQQRSFGFNGRKGQAGQPASLPQLGGDCAATPPSAGPVAVASASVQSGAVPLTVAFDASGSFDEKGGTLSYRWDFGDGTTSSEANPQHTYTVVGDYQASLTVSTDSAASQPASINIVATAPQPEDAICEFDITNEWQSGFTSKVTLHNDAEHAIDGWSVELLFEDGSQISGAWNASLTGNNPYVLNNASYNATIPPGGSASFGFNTQKAQSDSPAPTPVLGGICRANAVVNRPPNAQATVTPQTGNVPLTVTFDASASSDPDGDSLTFLWQIADLPPRAETSFTYEFTQPGTYPVTVVVGDGDLDSEPLSFDIVVTEAAAQPSLALNSDLSSLYFVSSKKVHVLETHTFGQITGQVSDQGEATLTIDLDSVDSGIEIRDGRMREHLFETAQYPQAEVSAAINVQQTMALLIGESVNQVIPMDVALHGVVVSVDVPLRITRLSDTRVLVQNTEPVLVQAADFEMEAGIEALRALAGLDVISYAVPVNFTLVFDVQQ